MTQTQASGRIVQLEETLQELIRAGEDFVRGPGCRVEVDLDYCAALAELEQVVEQSRNVWASPVGTSRPRAAATAARAR